MSAECELCWEYVMYWRAKKTRVVLLGEEESLVEAQELHTYLKKKIYLVWVNKASISEEDRYCVSIKVFLKN